MRTYGKEIPENKVIDKILHIIPIKFDHVVTIIIMSHGTNTMIINYKIAGKYGEPHEQNSRKDRKKRMKKP